MEWLALYSGTSLNKLIINGVLACCCQFGSLEEVPEPPVNTQRIKFIRLLYKGVYNKASLVVSRLDEIDSTKFLVFCAKFS